MLYIILMLCAPHRPARHVPEGYLPAAQRVRVLPDAAATLPEVFSTLQLPGNRRGRSLQFDNILPEAAS